VDEQRRAEADPAQMVVALNGDEAPHKHCHPEGDRVRLQPANPHMAPIYVAADQVTIQGIVVGLMRKFS
jgi:repressor LexA